MGGSHIDRKVSRSRHMRLARSFNGEQDPVSAEVRARHIESLGPMNIPSGLSLDLGSGMSPVLPGFLSGKGCVRLDWVKWGKRNGPDVVADIQALPFENSTFGLVFANLSLPWVGSLQKALAETRRVLAPGGLLTYATFGPDTLIEMRKELPSATPRTLGFFDMHDLADMTMSEGFAEPVAVTERLRLEYPSRNKMLLELRGFGALASTGMEKSLGDTASLRKFMAKKGKCALSFEVTYIHAWALDMRKPKGPDDWQEVRFSGFPTHHEGRKDVPGQD